MKIRKLSAWICVILLVILGGCSKTKETDTAPKTDSKTYRNVKVIDVTGEATLTRDENNQSVYKQMIINGNDNIITEAESTVDLLLDSDKYARIYENSDVTFKLEGNTDKGAIRIYLNKGGINSKIENKLSSDDKYEIHTPDAVMAVRGTEFDVLMTETEKGRQTTVTTKSGSVEITLLDGSGEQRLNESGDTTVIENQIDKNGNMGKPKFKDEENDNILNICIKCKKNLAVGKTHLLNCGKDHYSCDKLNHSICEECNKNVCDTSTHELLECSKHYRCSSSEKETVIHSMYCVVCKVYACQSSKTHTWAECGCVSCVGDLGENHIPCEFCGRCKSDNKEHAECGFCYGCIGNGEEHGDGICNKDFQNTSSN